MRGVSDVLLRFLVARAQVLGSSVDEVVEATIKHQSAVFLFPELEEGIDEDDS